MKTLTRRGFRATAAVAVAGSLIGVQALVSAASAGTTMTWTPGMGTLSNTGFWSNTCPAASAEPANLHSATNLAEDNSGAASTRTYVVGPNGLPDTAWQYAPAANVEAGISQGGLSATTTTGLSIAVNTANAGAAGRLLVMYTDTSGKQYVGEQQITTTAGWQTVTAGTMTWWRQYQGLTGPFWAAPNSIVNMNGWPGTLSDFLTKYGVSGSTFSTAFQFGCNGRFAVDHLQTTDSSAGVSEYDLQTPTSTTTATSGVSRVRYGSTTTITAATQSSENGVVATNPGDTETLQSSTDGTTWTTVTSTVTTSSNSGGASFTVKPLQKTMYRVQYSSKYPMYPQPSTSDPVTVAVLPGITTSVSSSRTNVGKAVTFTTRLTPALANATITFAQASGSNWTTIGTATTNSSGVATFVKSRSSSGAWKVHATVGAVTGYDAATSSAVSVGVYQPVSISASRSASSVYAGRTFRIYGTVSPHSSGISLQLQQYISRKWVTVSTGHTGTRGAYSFTKTARTVGTATFRVVAPASGYRLRGGSSAVKVTIVSPPVYNPPPPPPSGGGGGGGGSGIG
jgi:hypothetical protein